MIDGITMYLVAGTALSSALVGGVFYAFSTFVTAGLRRVPSEQGMATMQSINVTAVRPGLMVPFFGTTLAGMAVAIVAIVDWHATTSPLRSRDTGPVPVPGLTPRGHDAHRRGAGRR